MSTPERIYEKAKTLLELWQYKVDRNTSDAHLVFEDSTLIGCVAVFPDIDNLKMQWSETQEYFFRRYALNLRRAGEKSLNVNLVFLVIEETSDDFADQLENDFVAARKIVRSGVTSDNLLDALLPLTAMQNQVSPEIADPLKVLCDELELDEEELDSLKDQDSDLFFQLRSERFR